MAKRKKILEPGDRVCGLSVHSNGKTFRGKIVGTVLGKVRDRQGGTMLYEVRWDEPPGAVKRHTKKQLGLVERPPRLSVTTGRRLIDVGT